MSTLRRFFFDDGTSRKRWHITQRGKTQTVAYGRLGANLRSTEKTFNSPSAARENTTALVSAKLKAGYIEVVPSALTIKRPPRLRVATADAIRALEKSIGASLPLEYRKFLQSQNGGQPDPQYVATPGIPHIENVEVGFVYGLYPSERPGQSLSWGIKIHCPVLPSGHLPIAYGSDVVTLSLKRKSGCVFLWDRDTDTSDNDDKFVESDGHLIAGSFDEFLTRVAMFYELDEPTQEQLSGVPPNFEKLFKLFLRYPQTAEIANQIESEIKKVGGDLSGITDGEWPATNIRFPSVMQLLLKSGLNPEIVDTDGNTLLWQSAINHRSVGLLIKEGVKVDRRTSERETALIRAIYVGNAESVKTLLSAGANPNVRLPRHVSHRLSSNDKISRIIDRARKKKRK